jgi:hypothetical protein
MMNPAGSDILIVDALEAIPAHMRMRDWVTRWFQKKEQSSTHPMLSKTENIYVYICVL